MRVQCRLLDRAAGDRLDAVELVGDPDEVIAALASGPKTMQLEPVGADLRVEAVVRGLITDERGVNQLLIGDDPNAAAKVRNEPAAGGVPWSKAVAVLLGLWAIVAAATAGLRPYWYDESWSLAFARLPMADWAPLIRFGEINMVGYHAVLKGWTELVGTDVGLGRLPSVAAGVVGGGALYAVAARVWSKRIAFGAVVLFVTSAAMLDYAQQARAYSAAAAATTVSMWVLLRWRDRPRSATLALWSVTAGVAATLHVFAAFCIAGQLLGAFAASRRRRSLLVAGAAAAVLVAPVGYYLAFGTGDGSQVAWIPDPTWRTALDVAELVSGGRGLIAAAAMVTLAFSAGTPEYFAAYEVRVFERMG